MEGTMREIDILRKEIEVWKELAADLLWAASVHENRVDLSERKREVLEKARALLGTPTSGDQVHS
jgi:hypothetical protein